MSRLISRKRSPFRWALLLLVAFGVASCDDEGSILFPPPSVVAASVASEAGVAGQAGEVLPSPVRVEVRDVHGNPIPAVEVSASVSQGGGTIGSERYTTNQNGHFFIGDWRMGERPGPNAVTLEAEGIDPFELEVESGPGPAVALHLLGEDPDPAQVASSVTDLPRVRLVDQFDNPIPDAPILFSANRSGDVEYSEGATDASGEIAYPTWTLGSRAGRQELTARYWNQFVTRIAIEAEPGPAHALVWTEDSGLRAEVGSLLPIRPTVRVQDEWENGLPGFPVEFQVIEGDSEITVTEAITDDEGLATVDRWTLGSTPGLNRVEASTPGFPSVTLEVEAMDESWEPEGPYYAVHGVHINQASQRMDGSMPLIGGREGLLRAFVEASESGVPRPPVDLVLYEGDREIERHRVTSSATGFTPTATSQDGSSNSWNLRLDADLVRPGLGVRIEIDPDEEFGAVTRRFNGFPADGSIHYFDHFEEIPTFHVRFLAMRDASSGTTGNVDESNVDDFMDFTRRALPVGSDSAYYAGVFTTGLYDAEGRVHTAALSALLQHYRSTRHEIGDHYLHGIFPSDGPLNFAGVAYLPGDITNLTVQVGLTYDRLPQASATVAHELGHNLNVRHAPCGNPSGVDPNFPHSGALLGVAGWDPGSGSIQPPTAARDLMSYCSPRWISDYNYEFMLEWRRDKPTPGPSASILTEAPGSERLLVSGILSEGGAELQPVLTTEAPVQLPDAEGPYRLVGVTEGDEELFGYSFTPAELSHAPDPTERHFAYVIPLNREDRASLHTIRIEGPGIGRYGPGTRDPATPPSEAPGQFSRVAELDEGLAAPQAEVRRLTAAGGGEALEWDPAIFPVVSVWDRESGALVGLIRDGSLRMDLWGESEVEFRFEDGLRSFRWSEGTLEPLH